MLRSTTRSAIFHSWCRAGKRYLAFCFALGMLLGFAYAGTDLANRLPLMRSVASAPVSIVSLFLVWLLPFLITAFAVFRLPSWCILPIAFCKAFSYGFALRCIYLAFNQAGWLIWLLLLFTDTAGLISLYTLWLRNIPKRSASWRRDLLITLGILTLVTVFDFCIVSPFGVMLLNN